MAGLDKTYVSSWDDYKLIRDWLVSVGTTIDDRGNKITPLNWMRYPNISEIEFKESQNKCWERAKERFSQPDGKEYYRHYIETYGEDFINDPTHFFELVIWSTGIVEDVWLIRNCPLDIIQNRLKEQYGTRGDDSMYYDILNRTSEYDNFERNGEKHPHLNIKQLVNKRIKNDHIWWWIDIEETGNTEFDEKYEYPEYYEKENEWHFDHELYMSNMSTFSSSTCTKYIGNMSMRKIRRIVSKWDLPKGTKLTFCGTYKQYVVKKFVVTIK